MKQEQTIVLTNGRTEPARVRIEPWGDERMVLPGTFLRLDFEGPAGGAVEVEFEDEAVVVYGWSGSTVTIGG
jgi:hypothetical protein